MLPVHETGRRPSEEELRKRKKNRASALDGTYIPVNVSIEDRPRYQTRKNEIATNVLGVCSHDLQFIYLLPSWEGSAADSRVLRDAIYRRNGLKVPQGYTNGEGFLAPYRAQRYHLNDWSGHQPTSPKEFFNMKHSSPRNIIERAFGLLKGRWVILRSRSFYPIKTQCWIISACALLHNYIRREMSLDLEENSPLSDNSGAQELDELAGDVKWKAGNGFKPGFTANLEELMEKKLLGCGIKASPHIESRCKTLRKQYRAIVDMLGSNASGFDWNDNEKMVVVEKQILEDWVKGHPDAKGLQNKHFPHFDDLTLVFGKDRAVGIVLNML
ncbi:hypothetical protein SO802_030544 [Lithocarpus litseifolius]|uniref:DDE Tnp4 domain-containing protein n=1 Tax=Lithocarpus litseifolius TaxID=425828 RepID=A0AAW2BJL9_9ROSI